MRRAAVRRTRRHLGRLRVRASTDFGQALGAVLVGAAAIVSSLVLFAMQINVERMPHGLFRRLSSDVRLLAAFAATFLIALLVTASSLTLDRARIATTIFGAACGTILILALFLYSYRRAVVATDARKRAEVTS